MKGLRIRDGKPADLAALSEIENRAFATDRLSPRSLRRLIGRSSARLRVAVAAGKVVGYHLVLTRRGSSVARLYSIVIAAEARGQGFGERLLADAERQAARAGASVLRLEVRPDNPGAIRLYERRGYKPMGTYSDYYADGADAFRYRKVLVRTGQPRESTGGRGGESDEGRSPKGSGGSRSVMKMSRSAASGSPAPAGEHAALPALQYEA